MDWCPADCRCDGWPPQYDRRWHDRVLFIHALVRWADGLMAACHRAFDTREDGALLTDMRGPAMAGHFGWSGAAAKNEAL